MQPRWIGQCLAPAALLAVWASPLLAQTTPPEEAPNPTRQLESEIEQYPTPSAAPQGPTDARPREETRIPEEMHRATPAAKPQPKARPKLGAAERRSDISDAEVQRVFGQDTGLVELATLDQTQVSHLQQLLRDDGFYLGPVDGVLGPKTRAALAARNARELQLSRRLLGRGEITTHLATLLGLGDMLTPTNGATTATPPQ